MESGLISVIVPVYNVEKYLPRCVDSILAQTYTKLEIILVDDGSPDRCGEICDEYAKKDPRVQVLHQKNSGVSAARNNGIDISNGEYISFIDSDDWIEKDYFQHYIGAMRQDVDMVVSPYVQNDEKGDVISPFNKTERAVWEQSKAIQEILSWSHVGWGPVACLYRRAKINTIRFPVDIVYGEDLAFKYAVLKQCRVVQYIPYAGYHYFSNPNSACNSYDVIKRIQDLSLIEGILRNEPREIPQNFFIEQYIMRLVFYYRDNLLSENFSDKEKIRGILIGKLKSNIRKILYAQGNKLHLRIVALMIIYLPDIILRMIFKIYSSIKLKEE